MFWKFETTPLAGGCVWISWSCPTPSEHLQDSVSKMWRNQDYKDISGRHPLVNRTVLEKPYIKCKSSRMPGTWHFRIWSFVTCWKWDRCELLPWNSWIRDCKSIFKMQSSNFFQTERIYSSQIQHGRTSLSKHSNESAEYCEANIKVEISANDHLLIPLKWSCGLPKHGFSESLWPAMHLAGASTSANPQSGCLKMWRKPPECGRPLCWTMRGSLPTTAVRRKYLT